MELGVKYAGYLLWKTSRAWNHSVMDVLRDRGHRALKPSLLAVLIPLFEGDGKNIVEITTFSGLTKQTVSVYVQELCQKGYVSVERNIRDKRALSIVLTSKGKALEMLFEEVVHKVEQKMRNRLGSAGFSQLSRLLEKCAE
jgi:DNA-binding MarR family transcriptional regulator